jgi:hypothetical protein
MATSSCWRCWRLGRLADFAADDPVVVRWSVRLSGDFAAPAQCKNSDADPLRPLSGNCRLDCLALGWSNNRLLLAVCRFEMNTPVEKPWILGLTGGIGSGKSAAAQHFIDLGVHVVDADHAARWVVEPGRRRWQRLPSISAPACCRPTALDRAALRKLIFEVPEERRLARSLAASVDRRGDRPSSGAGKIAYAILVSPLLIESGQYAMTQRVLVIDAPQQLADRTYLAA